VAWDELLQLLPLPSLLRRAGDVPKCGLAMLLTRLTVRMMLRCLLWLGSGAIVNPPAQHQRSQHTVIGGMAGMAALLHLVKSHARVFHAWR
jgi:hypothetical protein